MATLSEVHAEETKILAALDEFCAAHGLEYSMIGGTMLGAVRHRGFIPWDDDIDVFMSMADFRVLRREFESDRYFLQTPETDLEMPFAMYKLRRNSSLMPEPGMEGLHMHQGIWIDIFVYTDAARGPRGLALQKFLFRLLMTYRCRYLNAAQEGKSRVYRLLTRLPRAVQLLLDRQILATIRLLGSKKSQNYFALDVGKYCVYPRGFFDQKDRYDFEGRRFLGPRDYDGFLRMVYGDSYMTPVRWSHIPDCSDIIIS